MEDLRELPKQTSEAEAPPEARELRLAIVGRPNVGKSSLFNGLAGHDRAIVTAVPGTTRDLVSERIDVNGLAVTHLIGEQTLTKTG